MNQWFFVIAAYAITVLPVIVLTALSYRAMRRAERQADALTRRD